MRLLLLTVIAAAAFTAEPITAFAQVAAPAPMSAEKKAAALRDLPYLQKVREADSIAADAAKVHRDADEARRMAAKQMDHARNDWRQFCIRARAENVSYNPEAEIPDYLIVLPALPHGNNRAAMEGGIEARKTAAKAVELEALSRKKAADASEMRAAAEMIPHSSPAAPAASVQLAVAFVPAAPAAPATSQIVAMWEGDKARLTTPDRDAKWLGCAAMPPLPASSGPSATTINAVVDAFNAALTKHDAAAMCAVMESPSNRALFAAYEQALIAPFASR